MLGFLERMELDVVIDNFFHSKMTTRKLRARSQSKQAEVFDLMQNWCIFFIQSLWRVFVLLSFLQKKEQSIIAMLSLTTIAKVDQLGSSQKIREVNISRPKSSRQFKRQ